MTSRQNSTRNAVANAAEAYIRAAKGKVSARDLGEAMRKAFPQANSNTVRGAIQGFNQNLPDGIARAEGNYWKA